MRHYDLIIGGKPSSKGIKTVIKSPYDGKEVGTVTFAGPEEVGQAAQATADAFNVISRMPAHQRAGILQKIADGIASHQDEFAEILRDEAGKPIRFAKAEVERAITTFAVAANETSHIDGQLLPLDVNPRGVGKLGLIKRFPVGPILGISPFNFPLMLVAHKVAPAIAAGNSIFLKPASQTPMSALKLAQVAAEAGLPPGVLNVIPCSSAYADSLVSDDRFKLVTFTGSAEVGWKIKAKAGKKKVTLELGGNGAAIVEPDANIEEAASKLAVGAFAFAGQICISVQRIYVHQSVFKTFVDAFLKTVKKDVPFGDPTDPKVLCGPMIDAGNVKRIEDLVADARAHGAECLLGGATQNRIIPPTVLTKLDPMHPAVYQEAFGPLVVIEPYQTFDEAIAMVNNSKYGLQAGIFSRDIEKVFKAFRELEVGGVIHNDGPTYRVDQMPYGGIKESGFGREGLRYAIEEMTEPKLLVLDTK